MMAPPQLENRLTHRDLYVTQRAEEVAQVGPIFFFFNFSAFLERSSGSKSGNPWRMDGGQQ